MTRRTRLLAAMGLSLTLAACGPSGPDLPPDDGPAGQGGSGGGSQAPQVSIVFPGPAALITESEITVRGTVSSQHRVRSVSVGGVAADLDRSKSPTTWRATLRLDVGAHVLRVRTEDQAGNVDPAAATLQIKHEPHLMPTAISVAVDPNGWIIAVDRAGFAGGPGHVYRIHPVSGRRELLSDNLDGEANQLRNPVDLAVGDDGTVYVTDRILRAVVEIDPSTGTRTILRDGFVEPAGVAVIDQADIVVVDRTARTVSRVSRVTGSHRVVSGPDDQDVQFGAPQDVTLSLDGTTFFVTDGASILAVDVTGRRRVVTTDGDGQDLIHLFFEDVVQASDGLLYAANFLTIWRVDPNTGERSFVWERPDPSPPFAPAGVAVEQDGTLVAVSNFEDVIYRVDPGTGARTRFSDAQVGSGLALHAVTDVTVARNGDLIVSDPNALGVGAVDPRTGNRRRLARRTAVVAVGVSGEEVYALAHHPSYLGIYKVVGDETVDVQRDGEPLLFPWTLVGLPDGRVVVADWPDSATGEGGALILVDPALGEATLLSGTRRGVTRGTGPTLDRPGEIAFRDGALYVADEIAPNVGEILRIDLASGDRTRVTEGLVGPSGLDVLPDGRLVTLDQSRIELTDPRDGARTIVSGPTLGTGITYDRPTGLAAEPTGMVVVCDNDHNALIRIDPVTGDRAVISH